MSNLLMAQETPNHTEVAGGWNRAWYDQVISEQLQVGILVGKKRP